MSLFRPRKPSKPGALLSIWEMLFNGKFPLKDTPSLKWDKGPSGYAGRVIFPPSSGGGASGWDWMYPTHKELDPTLPYSKGKWAYITSGNDLVTTGLTDLTTGENQQACEGFWLAACDIPPATDAGYDVPTFPYPSATGDVTGTPLKGDLDNVGEDGLPYPKWIYFGQVNCGG